MKTMNTSPRRQLGFSIIEALIALVIMGFGILSLAGMQAGLSRSSDDAKQRTEAVRLAQEKIESLRSFTGIAATVIGQATTSLSALNWDALGNGSDIITTNAAYTRTWTFGGSSADNQRALTVSAAWTNRANETQTVSLSSVLSKTNPADSGFLGFPLPNDTNLKRPKNRNIDIPIRAIDLGNGQSGVKFGSTGQYVVFNNLSADVVKICTPALTGIPTEADIIAALTSNNLNTSNCTDIAGYIVSGYVGRDSSVSDTDWNAIEAGLAVNHSGITRNAAGASGITCQLENTTDQNSGATIANYKSYLCVVPLAPPSANTPYNWSGTIRLGGPAAWNLSGNKYFVCRYQYTPTSSLTDANQRNVQPYVAVNKSIDQQNYLVSTTTNATSAADPICPSSMTVAGVSVGVLHQDCRSASNLANFATACPLLNAASQLAVTYDVNSGTGTVPTDATTYTLGNTVTVLASPSPTRSGYTFGGWSRTSTGVAVTSFTIAANTTLYAQWTQSSTTLASPTPVWTGLTDPKTLIWPAVINATGYVVSTCTSTNNNGLTACIPTGSSSNNTFSLNPAPSSKDTICYSIVATGSTPYTTSPPSIVKCLYQKTGTYTYQ